MTARSLDSRFPVRVLALVLGLLWLGACRSAPKYPEGPLLPFHVALIPTEIHDTSVLTANPSEPVYPERSSGARTDDMRLELTTAEVSQALRRELEHAFVRTTLLALPSDPARLASLSPAQRDQYWQEEARKAGADLLLRTRLSFDPAIDGARNEKFWLNLPLFLLGGPMCYFVGDRRYGLSARLQAEVFDTSEGHDALGDYALLTIPLYVEFRDVDLRFLDRADGVGQYALSLLVPAGLLARETDAIEAELEERLPQDLGRELAVKVVSERSQFEQNLALGAFSLEAGAARMQPGTDGTTRVSVPVRELSSPGSLYRYELRAGETLLAGRDFPPVSASDGRQLIDDELVLPSDARYLKVRVVDASANTRSYTLKVPAQR